LPDRQYWDRYYASPHPDIAEPSSFARASLERLRAGDRLFELGCGNGRDALFFARNGLRVVACDQSEVAIEKLRTIGFAENGFAHPPEFFTSEFERLGPIQPLDAIYSRFTLHAITEAEAEHVLLWSWRSLRPGGILLIEARSVNGSLYGIGEPAGRDAFVHDGHYRRFVRREELTAALGQIGFTILEEIEDRGLAVFGHDDPVVVRVVGRVPDTDRL
jgi:SAM-dependent methyltransferase